MFKLLEHPLDRELQSRKDVARLLLDAPEQELESTTLKIRARCRVDLEKARDDGILQPGSCLHALLSMTALRVKLHSGSMESLNSMVKTAMSCGNNARMTLELLSSRVNARKTLTMMSPGVSLQDVRPVADKLARSSILYQGFETEVLQTQWRWTPPEPRPLPPNNPAKHSPALTLGPKQRRAVPVHTKLRRALQLSRDRPVEDGRGFLVGVHIGQVDTRGNAKVFLLAELSARVCWLLQVLCGADTELAVLPTTLTFVSALDVLAEARPDKDSARDSWPDLSVAVFQRRPIPADMLRAFPNAAFALEVVEKTRVTVLRPALGTLRSTGGFVW